MGALTFWVTNSETAATGAAVSSNVLDVQGRVYVAGATAGQQAGPPDSRPLFGGSAAKGFTEGGNGKGLHTLSQKENGPGEASLPWAVLLYLSRNLTYIVGTPLTVLRPASHRPAGCHHDTPFLIRDAYSDIVQ